jgi:hypothetical protein
VRGERGPAPDGPGAVAELEDSLGSVDIEPLGSDLCDTGAAAAPLYVAIATSRMQASAAPASDATIAVGSKDGGRGVIALAAEPPPPRAIAPRAPERPSPAAEAASVGRRILETQRRRFMRLQGKIARRVFEGAAAAFDKTEPLLRELAGSDLGDPAHLDRLGAATAVVRELCDRLQRVLLGEPRRADDTALRGQAIVAPIAADVLGVLRSLDAARPLAIAKVAATAAARRIEPPAEEPRFVASSGSPTVFDLAPLIGAWAGNDDASGDDESEDEDDEPEDTDDAADTVSEDLDGEVATLPPAHDSAMDLVAVLDSALETIARLEILRRAEGPIPWSPFMRDFDDRMLEQLDLVWSLATPTLEAAPQNARPRTIDLVGAITRMPVETDGGAAFARALVLSCASAKETARLAASGLGSADPTARRSYADALALGSSSSLTEPLEELCQSADPGVVSFAAYTLGRRRAARIGVVLPLVFHPDSSVRRSAAFALSYVAERGGAVRALEAAIAEEHDIEAFAFLAEALLRLKGSMAIDRVARGLDELVLRPFAAGSAQAAARPDATPLLRLLAAASRPNDWPAMQQATASPSEIACLGWYGRVVAVESLVGLLERAKAGMRIDPEAPRAAARALARITGAFVVDSNRGRRLLDRELARSSGRSPADLPDRPAADAPLELDPNQWRAYWQARGTTFGVGKKYRFGDSWEPSHAIEELRAPGVLDVDRKLAVLEYDLAVPAAPLPDTNDWIARQLGAFELVGKDR